VPRPILPPTNDVENDENVELPVQSEPEAVLDGPKGALDQSRNLGELLRSTNNSLAQLKVELHKMNEGETAKGEINFGETLRSNYQAPLDVSRPTFQPQVEPLNHSLVAYHKDLISELRDDNHKLLIADLKLKNGQEQLKQTNSLLMTENGLLKDRLETEKLKREIKEQEVASLNRSNAELGQKVLQLERELTVRAAKEVDSALEVRRKEELIRTINDQMRSEADARRRHNTEFELEIARNGNLQAENEKLKLEGKHLLEAVEVLKSEISTLKRSNQEVLAMLRY